MRWTRTLNLAAGSYRFSMTVDDGSRLWVNGYLQTDAWKDRAPLTYTGDIYLPGRGVPVEMEFYENSGEPAGDPGLTFTVFAHTILQGIRLCASHRPSVF